MDSFAAKARKRQNNRQKFQNKRLQSRFRYLLAVIAAVSTGVAYAGIIGMEVSDTPDILSVNAVERDATMEYLIDMREFVANTERSQSSGVGDVSDLVGPIAAETAIRASQPRFLIQVSTQKVRSLEVKVSLSQRSFVAVVGGAASQSVNIVDFDSLTRDIVTVTETVGDVSRMINPHYGRSPSTMRVLQTHPALDERVQSSGLHHTTIKGLIVDLTKLRGHLLALTDQVTGIEGYFGTENVAYALSNAFGPQFVTTREAAQSTAPVLDRAIRMVERTIEIAQRALLDSEHASLLVPNEIDLEIAQAITEPDANTRRSLNHQVGLALRSRTYGGSGGSAGGRGLSGGANQALRFLPSQGVTDAMHSFGQQIFLPGGFDHANFASFLAATNVVTTELVDYLDDGNTGEDIDSSTDVEVREVDLDNLPNSTTGEDTAANVNEPGSIVLIVSGLLFLFLTRRRFANQRAV